MVGALKKNSTAATRRIAVVSRSMHHTTKLDEDI